MSANRTQYRAYAVTLAVALGFVPACDEHADDDHGHDDHGHDDHGHDDDGHHGHDHETETITSVTLTLTPEGGGEAVTAAFRDPDGDGGMSGTAEPLVLAAQTQYTLTVEFSNELEDPAEDVTEEIAAEAEDHQLFFYGDAVAGPATTNAEAIIVHAYADRESDYGMNTVGDDLPVGLRNTITTQAAGSGELEVMLRHIPELNDASQKRAGLAELLAEGEALPGDVDANVHFDVTVQ